MKVGRGKVQNGCRYGGTVIRPTVASQADWFVYSMQPLIDSL